MKRTDLSRLFARKRSFKYRLIAAFCFLSILPLILVQMTAYYNIAAILQKNIDTLERSNLVQTRKLIRTKLDFYEDLLYRLYTDENIIDLMNRIDAGVDGEFNSSRLRLTLHSYVYTLPFVQALTVITSGAHMVFDDILTGYNTKASWIDVTGGQPARLYASVIDGNDTVIMSSKLASYFSGRPYYLFHLAHRFIDYRDIRKKDGVIILSVDERMLGEICDEVRDAEAGGGIDNVVFILDRSGTIVSYPDKSKIGTRLDLPPETAGRSDAVRRLVWGDKAAGRPNLAIYEIEEPKAGWSIVVARDQDVVYRAISAQQRLTVMVLLLSVAALLVIIFYITERLTRSVESVAAAMNTAAAGEFSVRIEKDRKMPLEMEKIADNFNDMIERIDGLVNEVHAASKKQRDAEIAALEAQVNPHFLYNTLDTINWMAIDRDQFEISNAISALARILRYGIDDSAGVVEIRAEAEWLRLYVSLQQIRLKNSFEYSMEIEPEALDRRIHKLLFQPFVENAIIHAFKGVEGKHELRISIGVERGGLTAVIEDNGRGMDEETIAALNAGRPRTSSSRSRIGMHNAIERIKMYYGETASIVVESGTGRGTRIRIGIPVS